MATQQTNISLGYGIRRTPSLGDDGELSEAMNLIPRGGELVNIQQPVEVSGVTLNMYDTLLAVHETAGVKRYIVKNTDTTSATLSGNIFRLPPTITSVKVMGNCLVTTDTNGLLYYLWDNDHYKEMGDSIAELQMYFELEGKLSLNSSSLPVKVVSAEKNDMEFKNLIVKSSGVLSTTFKQIYLSNGTTPLSFSKGDVIKIKNYGSSSFTLYAQAPGRLVELVSVKKNSEKVWVAMDTGTWPVGSRIFPAYPTATEDYSVAFWRGSAQAGTLQIDNTVSNVNAVMGCANSWLKESMSDDHKFVMPFFVRAAIELYDGTYIHHTVPSYMVPNSGAVPFIAFDTDTLVAGSSYNPVMYGVKCDLKYRIKKEIVDELSKWSDLISGISVAVTDPIYRYDEGAEYKSEENIFSFRPVSIDQISRTSRSSIEIINGEASQDKLELNENQLWEAVSKFYTTTSSGAYRTLNEICLPEKKDEEVLKDTVTKSVFHEIANIKLEELNELFGEDAEEETLASKVLDLSEVDLSTTSTKKVIPDDFRSHDKLSPSSVFVYNGRVTIANVKSIFWNGFEAGACQGLILKNLSTNTSIVNLNIAGTRVSIKNSASVIPVGGLNWVFFPNENAESIEIYEDLSMAVVLSDSPSQAPIAPITVRKKYTIPLKKHDFLNGAYWFGSIEDLKEETYTAIPDIPDAAYRYENSVYTSNVNDPFVFPLEGRTTVGSGAVLGLSTSAKALSQGQFGQFPLLAFCTDGIWALSVGDSGNYVAKQPISRDVVNNADSITQIDSAVVFSCEQGLKMISGSDIQVLSERIDGLNILESNFTKIPESLSWPESVQFTTALAGAKILYDYPHGHLHVFPDRSNSFGYVLDLASGEWSKQKIAYPIKTVVQGYPYSLLQSGLKVYEYRRTTTAEGTQDGYILTRSYSFGNPLSKKALYDLRTIGQRVSKNTKFKVVVYISDNNVTWTKLKSLKARSAKYYRFLIKTSMTDLETLSGISLQFQERYTNKMR